MLLPDVIHAYPCLHDNLQVKGPFTKKMLRRGAFVDKHFENDQNMSFALMEDDPITKTKVCRAT